MNDTEAKTKLIALEQDTSLDYAKLAFSSDKHKLYWMLGYHFWLSFCYVQQERRKNWKVQ